MQLTTDVRSDGTNEESFSQLLLYGDSSIGRASVYKTQSVQDCIQQPNIIGTESGGSSPSPRTKYLSRGLAQLVEHLYRILYKNSFSNPYSAC